MALIVETGAGVSGANSYVSLADAQAFINARELGATLTEGHLLRAMDALTDVQWSGYKAAASNPLPWPRTHVYDADGFSVDTDSVPASVVNAQIWLAYHIASGDDPAAIATPAIKSEKVDVLETTYAVSESATTRISLLSLPNVVACLSVFSLTGSRRIARA